MQGIAQMVAKIYALPPLAVQTGAYHANAPSPGPVNGAAT